VLLDDATDEEEDDDDAADDEDEDDDEDDEVAVDCEAPDVPLSSSLQPTTSETAPKKPNPAKSGAMLRAARAAGLNLLMNLPPSPEEASLERDHEVRPQARRERGVRAPPALSTARTSVGKEHERATRAPPALPGLRNVSRKLRNVRATLARPTPRRGCVALGVLRAFR
jgi:hypothetical protein